MTTTAKAGALNTKHVMIAFGVGNPTLLQWRKGSARKTAMPCVVKTDKGRNAVSYSIKDLTKWAKDNGVKIVVPFAEALQQQEAAVAKPGPKPSIAPNTEKKANVAPKQSNVAAKAVKAKTAKPAPAAKKPATKKLVRPAVKAKQDKKAKQVSDFKQAQAVAAVAPAAQQAA